MGEGENQLSSDSTGKSDSAASSNDKNAGGASDLSFSIPPDDLIFGDEKPDSEDEQQVSIKPITPKAERKSGTGWTYSKGGTPEDEPPSQVITGPQPAQMPPLPAAPPPPAGLGSAAPPPALGGKAPLPPPPPPPTFNWATPAAPAAPAAPSTPSGSSQDLVLPDLTDNRPPPPGLPPSLPWPDSPRSGTATGADSGEQPHMGPNNQGEPRTPLSRKPPARGRIPSDYHMPDHHQDSAPASPVPQEPPPAPTGPPRAPEPPPLPPQPPPLPPQPNRAPEPPTRAPQPPPKPPEASPKPQQLPQRRPQQGPGKEPHPQDNLPKAKSFGQLMMRKPGIPAPGERAPTASGPPQQMPKPGASVFTVIGDKDTPTRPPNQPAAGAPPSAPPRVPFPDDSLPAMTRVEEPGPPPNSWENAGSPGPFHESNFDNLPSEDWKLDDEENEGPASSIGEEPSPFAPPAVSGDRPGGYKPGADQHGTTVQQEPKAEPSSLWSARLDVEETSADVSEFPEPFASPQDAEPQPVADEQSAARDFAAAENPEPSMKLVEETQSDSQQRPVPNSKQFREACLASSTADSAMGNENYKVALPLFKKAYKLFKKAAATDSQEFGNCLHKLADCYYHDEDYKEALSQYEEFNAWSTQRGSRPDVLTIIVNLKRARTFQKLDRLQECEMAFETTAKLANEILPVSHPLFPVVYNSYVAMLKYAGTDAERIKQVEEQFSDRMMTSSRSMTIPQDLQQELSAWTEMEPVDQEKLERQRQLRLSRQMFQHERSRPEQFVHSIKHSGVWRTLLIVTVVVGLVGSLTLMVFGAIALLDPGDKTAESASRSQVDPALEELVGKTFTSVDGLKTATVGKDGQVRMIFGNDTQSMPVKAGLPKTGLAEDVRHHMFGKNSYLLEQVGEGLRDPEGTILYPPDAKNLRIPKAMQEISDLANYYYSRHQSRYPKRRKDISDLGPDVRWENPLGSSMKPLIKAHEFEKYDGDLAFSNMLEKFRKGKNVFDQDGKPGVPPGLVECLSLAPFDEYHTEDGIAFMIRSYDSAGKFLTSSVPGEVYVVVQKNGMKYTVVKPEDVKSPIKDSSKTTVHVKMLTTH